MTSRWTFALTGVLRPRPWLVLWIGLSAALMLLPSSAWAQDGDNDGHDDDFDNCPADSNSDQRDSDLDYQGDICDACPLVPGPANLLLTSPDVDINEGFGLAVAVSGTIAVVGSPFDNGFRGSSGSAYIFEKQEQDWVQASKILVRDASGLDRLGTSVAASGNTVIVGASGHDPDYRGESKGSAYIFEKQEQSWVQTQKIGASDPDVDDQFGAVVFMSANIALVGAPFDDEGAQNAGGVYVFEKQEQNWVQTQKIIASDADADDQFGSSVSLSKGVMLVGAVGDDDEEQDSGSVYIFEKQGSNWVEIQKLNAGDPGESDAFGHALSISENLMVVGAQHNDEGAEDAGSAYIFEKVDQTWVETQKLVSPTPNVGDAFGASVTASRDRIVVGARFDDTNGEDSGHVYTFAQQDGLWVQTQTVTLSSSAGDELGAALAVSNTAIIVGAIGADGDDVDTGVAHLIETFHDNDDDGVCSTIDNCPNDSNEDQADRDNDTIGDACDLDNDNDTIEDDDDNCPLVANEDQLDLDLDELGDVCDLDDDNDEIENTTDNCPFVANPEQENADQDDLGDLCDSCPLVPGPINSLIVADDGREEDAFGRTLAISGNTLVVGAPLVDDSGIWSGAAYIFEKQGQDWIQMQRIAPDRDGFLRTRHFFSNAVAISGNTVLVGANKDNVRGEDSGAAYIFEKQGQTWVETQKFTASDTEPQDEFGRTVSIQGNTAVVGAPFDDDDGDFSGSVYIFEKQGQTWVETQKLTASDATIRAFFGNAVSLSGNTLLIGANGTNTNGNNAGSAYIFEKQGQTWVETQKLTASDSNMGNIFGWKVALSNDIAVIGAQNNDDGAEDAGSAYIFEKVDQTWRETRKILPPTPDDRDNFGSSVAVSGNMIVIGTRDDDDENGVNAGSAYTFEKQGQTWVQTQLFSSTPRAGGGFGAGVAVSSAAIVVGADYAEHDDTVTGNVHIFERLNDNDDDGVCSNTDNCSTEPNPDQRDNDDDFIGDICDPDDDNDGSDDSFDNCPLDANADQFDLDDDNIGDTCDPDDDNDTIEDDDDNCPLDANTDQRDNETDGIGDVCDPDDDNDTIEDDDDNCPLDANEDQTDTDDDTIGDVCDPDDDNDTVLDTQDNCRLIANTTQDDLDNDNIGDICDPDDDNDDVLDTQDNCPLDANTDQQDTDQDDDGDVCDPDDDDDTILDDDDNCPLVANTTQDDLDDDGTGDACDEDVDGDDITNTTDNCPNTPNPDQRDLDQDDIGDVCDDDDDNDGVPDTQDNCPLDANADQADADGDAIGDVCDEMSADVGVGADVGGSPDAGTTPDVNTEDTSTNTDSTGAAKNDSCGCAVPTTPARQPWGILFTIVCFGVLVFARRR